MREEMRTDNGKHMSFASTTITTLTNTRTHRQTERETEMTARSFRFSVNEPVGRTYGYGGGKKVGAAVATSAYRVDCASIDESMQLLSKQGYKTFMPRPDDGGFLLREYEVAFVTRNSGNRVRTALNGLDWQLAQIYPDDPELVRQLLFEMVQPVGIVEEDAETRKACPLVTLRISGTHFMGAPHTYNFGDYKKFGIPSDPTITPGCAVVMDIPNLRNPIQFGNEVSGVPGGKVRMVARAMDKRSTATRIMTLIGAYQRDPEKMKLALQGYSKIASSWESIAKATITSHQTSALMFLDVLLRNNVVQVPPNVNELLAPGGGGAPLSSEDTVVRIAEYTNLIKPSSTAEAALTTARRAFWKNLTFEAISRMLPGPDPTTNKLNAAYQFGFVVNRNANTALSRARIGGNGRVKNDSLGKLFNLSISHWRLSLEALTIAVYSERKNMIGVALTEPSVAETSQFQMLIMPHGGMVGMN